MTRLKPVSRKSDVYEPPFSDDVSSHFSLLDHYR